ncbi:restriction endonuclease subunit S [Hydrogenophaga flava]|uniref:restriction endonuclease subunit S n=1 Tax=Hydrogenophaga flava TaxID=65657 RepID=UPI0008251EEF|nr:restriction endonuclease subunit S [Hydrogenophaga flava]
MSFPRYPAYKDSGVEWLGQVPCHWRVDRLKASIVSSKNGIWGEESKGDENDIPCVRVADFDRQKLRVELSEPTIRNVTAKERDGRTLNKGDLLLEKSGGGESQPVGCVVLYDDERPAVCSNFVARVQLAPGMVSSFWRYVHAAAYAVRLTIGSINQTSGIQNLDQDRYYNERAAFPTFKEQTAIATFLDHETAKIDALVAEQERLIELLKEKRQAVISHAVTMGLDPSVPMKDSGVEWLGEVPAHWSTPAMYMRYSSELGKMLDSAKITGAHLTPYVRNVDVQWGAINFDDLPLMDIPEGEYTRYTVKSGDLLVCEGGEVGRAAIVPSISSIYGYQKALHRLRALDDSEDSAFMFFTLLWAASTGIFDQSGSSTIAHLTGEQLRKYRFPKPPIREQKAIVEFLGVESARLENLIAEARAVIELLQERRTALISAAVTGQIDVRGWVPAATAA